MVDLTRSTRGLKAMQKIILMNAFKLRAIGPMLIPNKAIS